MTDPAAPVLVDVRGAVATVTLNRPDRLNAITPDLSAALLDALHALRDDRSVRVVVLTGAGRGFCAGGDLAAGLGAMVGPPPLEAQSRRLREHTGASALLHGLPQVTIAAINGACAGAGLSLALACDLRVAAASARFATAFLTAGVSGDYAGIWFVTQLIGTARARELYLLPDRLDAETLQRLGLLTRVLPDESFSEGVAELVDELVARAPLALAGMKANLRDAEHLDLAGYLDVETTRQASTVTTEDALEAGTAFFEKREPRFQGR
jgi:2-(1,2-epoxy-1,2-dihydrophenyl)acetyl-CoA isomerase